MESFPIRGVILIIKGCLIERKEEGIPFIMENNIIQMAATATLSVHFYEIFHHQMVKWLPYALSSIMISIHEVLNRRCPVVVERSPKMFNHRISVANWDHLFE